MKRAIQDLGYGLHRLRNKRALDPATKKKRVQWAREHAGREQSSVKPEFDRPSLTSSRLPR